MPNNAPSRNPGRSTAEFGIIHEIIDQALYCTIAYCDNGIAHQIPTGFFRDGQDIFIHASRKSLFMNSIIGNQVSYSMTLLEGLVLAPTAFDHSFNYRSVVGYSFAEEVADPVKKKELLCEFTDRYVPGRIGDVGQPSDEQVSITKVVKFSLDNAIAKMRQGGANCQLNEDSPWCGIIPLKSTYDVPQADPDQLAKEIPDYISGLTGEF